MESEISSALYRLGIRANSKSFFRTVLAVQLAIENRDRLTNMGKLYREVGRQTGCSAFCVERSVRRVADRAWLLNPKGLTQMAQCEMHWRPTASEFIDILAEYVAGVLASTGN